MKKTVKIYYLFLISAFVLQAVTTVYKLGLTVSHQSRINHLQEKKVNLESQAQLLEKAISKELSLTQNQLDLTASYQPISSPLIIGDGEMVALR